MVSAVAHLKSQTLGKLRQEDHLIGQHIETSTQKSEIIIINNNNNLLSNLIPLLKFLDFHFMTRTTMVSEAF